MEGKIYEIICRKGLNRDNCKFMMQDLSGIVHKSLHCSICSFAGFVERIRQKKQEEEEKTTETENGQQ